MNSNNDPPNSIISKDKVQVFPDYDLISRYFDITRLEIFQHDTETKKRKRLFYSKKEILEGNLLIEMPKELHSNIQELCEKHKLNDHFDNLCTIQQLLNPYHLQHMGMSPEKMAMNDVSIMKGYYATQIEIMEMVKLLRKDYRLLDLKATIQSSKNVGRKVEQFDIKAGWLVDKIERVIMENIDIAKLDRYKADFEKLKNLKNPTTWVQKERYRYTQSLLKYLKEETHLRPQKEKETSNEQLKFIAEYFKIVGIPVQKEDEVFDIPSQIRLLRGWSKRLVE